MLSILIPIYNYNAVPLVKKIGEQGNKSEVLFEIICVNDASTLFLSENQELSQLPGVRYTISDKNQGRSKTRNQLAQMAQFDWLLFLDTDVMPVDDFLIERYLPFLVGEKQAIYGGIVYSEKKPEKSQLLRWVYGRAREALTVEQRQKNPYLSFLTLNFLIHKDIFKIVAFNEDIPNMRHEDSLFSYHLKINHIPITHINNPVEHLGLDHFENAIIKEKESLFALKNLLDQNLIEPNYIKIGKVFCILKKYRLAFLGTLFYHGTRFFFLKNIGSSNPSLFIFDLYRLGYLCKLETDL